MLCRELGISHTFDNESLSFLNQYMGYSDIIEKGSDLLKNI